MDDASMKISSEEDLQKRGKVDEKGVLQEKTVNCLGWKSWKSWKSKELC
jgi:hypothetical protein